MGDDGAEAGGELVLASGRRLPVVLWDAALLFARSPLGSDWTRLPGQRDATGSDLLDLAARLLLLWRHGGLTVDLHASADQVLKVSRVDTLRARENQVVERVSSLAFAVVGISSYRKF